MRNSFKKFVGLVLVSSSLFLSGCVVPVRVEGTAMEPNFSAGDRLFMRSDLTKIGRGDVIYFKYPKDETKTYLKRVIGLPGERVEIKNGLVLIDGQVIDEPYVDTKYDQSGTSFPERTVPQNHYYVMGDNRDNSSDSRYWGTVDKRLLLGKYYATYYSAQKK